MDRKSIVCIVAASILWGSSGLFIHALSPLGFGSLQMTAVRGVVSAVCFHVYVILKDRSLYVVKFRDLIIFLCAGLCVYGTAACYFSAVIASSVSTAVILMYTAPIYVMIFSVSFLGEKLIFPKIVSVAIMIVGCALVSGIIGGLKFSMTGILLGIASGVVYSGYNILAKIEMMRGSNSLSATMYAYTVMAVVGLFVSSPVEIWNISMEQPLRTIPILLGLGIFTCALPYFLYTMALRNIPAGTATALGILEPVAATLFSVIFLEEHLSVQATCGIVLVIAAVLLLNRSEVQLSKNQ